MEPYLNVQVKGNKKSAPQFENCFSILLFIRSASWLQNGFQLDCNVLQSVGGSLLWREKSLLPATVWWLRAAAAGSGGSAIKAWSGVPRRQKWPHCSLSPRKADRFQASSPRATSDDIEECSRSALAGATADSSCLADCVLLPSASVAVREQPHSFVLLFSPS